MRTFLEIVFVAAFIAGAAWAHPGLGVMSGAGFGLAVIYSLDGDE